MATLLGSLLVSLGLESGEFKSGLDAAEKQLRASQRRIENVGRNMSALGQKLSLAVSAPLAVFAKNSVEGFVEQEKAMADVNAALKSMGNVSGKTSDELAKTADALEMRSLFDAEVILKEVTAQLLTFGNVAGEQFDRAQQAAVDMATRLGTEPQSAAIMLGKALNDPIKGITALTRVGVQFTDAQKDQIKAMSEAGNVAGAQGVILAEVERQFKGAAAAAADASPWRKAQVAIGQAMDKIGEAILPVIKPVAEAIAGIARAFSSLPEPMQKVVVVAGILAAALGPVLMIFGPLVTAMAPFLATLKLIAAQQGIFVALRAGLVGLATAFGPILIAVGAIYLAWKNWDKIAPALQPLLEQLRAIGEGMGLLEQQAGATSAEIGRTDSYRKFGSDLAALNNQIQSTFDALEQASIQGGQNIRAAVQSAWQSFEEWHARTQASANGIKSALANLASSVATSMQRIYTGVKTWIVDKLNAVWAGVSAKIETVKKSFFNLYDAVVGNSYIPDMVDGIKAQMARLQSVMVDPALKATDDAKAAFRQLASDVSSIMERLFPEIAKFLSLRNDLDTIDKGVAAGFLTPEQAQEANTRARAEVRGTGNAKPSFAGVEEVSLDVGATLDRMMKSMPDINAGLDKLIAKSREWKEALGRVASDAFAEIGYQLKGVLHGAQSFSDALKNILAQLADMAFSAAWKSLGGALSLPGFATGTPSAPRGMAWVGERGPELVDFRGGERVWNHSQSMRMVEGRGSSNQYIDMKVYTPDADSFRRSERQVSRGMQRRLNQ